jgi:quinol monooxygenase YgiN
MSITNLAFLRARPGREEALGQALLAVMEPSRAESGCEAYELHRSSQEPALVHVRGVGVAGSASRPL